MKICGYLAIDLEGAAPVEAPTRGPFARWLGALAGHKDVVRQAIPMARVLAVLHEALAVRRHDNLIRFAVDGGTLYDDLTGIPGDLALALDAVSPEALAVANRLQLVVEEEDDDPELYTVLNVIVHRHHAPGRYPVWIRATALAKSLLRREGEKPKPYQDRIGALVRDTPRLVQQSLAACDRLVLLLEDLGRSIASRLPVAARRVDAQVELGLAMDDYFLSLRPEYWDAAQALVHRSAGMILPAELEPSAPLAAVVATQHAELARLEKELGSAVAVDAPDNRGWRAYARRRVINPRTGRICQIGSLPPDQQGAYRTLFNKGAASELRVAEPGVLTRLLGKVRRGVTGGVKDEVERMRARAPSTYAFLTNDQFRRKVYAKGARLLGQEMIDLADAVAVTAAKELYETGRIPFGWFKGNKVLLRDEDHAAIEHTHEQMADLAELVVGTMIPIGAFATGGPLGGAMALAGVKVFQAALNWHSKRTGGREYTILPSAWHERRATQHRQRAPDRLREEEVLAREADRIVDRDRREGHAELIALQRRLALDFRDFGRRLVAGEVEIDDGLMDVSTLKESDIKAAIASEAAEEGA